MAKRFQNTVATGRFTLSASIVYAIIILMAGGVFTVAHSLQLLSLGISTFFMIVLNNSNSLIRVYSRLVSCSFLVLTVMYPPLLETISGSLVQLSFILIIIFLFRAYQDRQGTGTIFYAFVFLGIISTQFIQILFFIPFLWILMFTSLQEGSLRVFIASILGIIMPYWFWLCYSIYYASPLMIWEHIQGIATFGPLFGGLFTPSLLITTIFILMLGVTGIVHFISSGYADNIKTRMFYNAIITLFLVSLAFLILQPQHSDYLLRIAIICLSPLIAHFYTFTNSWLTNLSFYGTIAAILVITILNTWIF